MYLDSPYKQKMDTQTPPQRPLDSQTKKEYKRLSSILKAMEKDYIIAWKEKFNPEGDSRWIIEATLNLVPISTGLNYKILTEEDVKRNMSDYYIKNIVWRNKLLEERKKRVEVPV